MDLKIVQKNLRSHAYNKIKKLILDNRLKPGEKIIQEKMAQKLGISRIPLVQALALLENEGLIECISRKGFFVRQISTQEFYEILDIRAVLEALAVERLAQSQCKQMRTRLSNFLKDFETYCSQKNKQKYFELDKKFHYYLVESSNSNFLIELNERLNILLLTYTKGFQMPIEYSMEHHKKIINAIIDNKPKEAFEAMKEHLQKVKEFFK